MASTPRRLKGISLSKSIVYGTIATPISSKKAIEPGSHTHNWVVSVRGVNNEDISPFIKKVNFKLHESFANPNRVVEKAPFEVSETGWGEFEIVIKIYFNSVSHEKPVTLYHPLRLHPYEDLDKVKASGKNPIVQYYQYEELIFNEPTEAMYKLLTESGSSTLPLRRTEKHRFSVEYEQEELERLEAVHQEIQSKTRSYVGRIQSLNEELARYRSQLAALEEARK
ncbi:yeats-domain-containing protein [Basidiobolus meristosporus CBS 931.73]|uniref:Protein AF-9 homolog n=1 Tax=Basidiobolus meristosporus CBS 931.73 TaxID=1314790 RepID=A0A1Y1YMH0_9FUNG|nr:yeats-domain-containing protein [Basidiobolus meristosporus CBS 931.73]|eukprot:ORX99043.1 yeats-domain-containing protein [Basidiobolus meristosporus CBS 931.73]